MTLIQLFTNIANAIRAKTGSSETIKAEDFPTEIADITTGHLDNTEYAEANDDLDDILEGSTPTTIYPPDWSQIGYNNTPQSIIDDFNYAKEIYDNWDSSITNLSSRFENDKLLSFMPTVDTSLCTNMESMFYDCTSLKEISLLNTNDVTNMKSTFQNCILLKSMPLLNTEKVTNMFSMFSGCTNLKEIPQFNTANINSIVGFNFIFTNCSKLSNESLNNILKMCINATSYTGTKTLKKLGLTQAQTETCQTLSNYQDFINAGWTTGY
jgi:surface protein